MTHYHDVAGTRVDRIAGLSDALFAIALTLTVLEVRIPMHEAISTETALVVAIAHVVPRVLTYLLSFLTLGLFWVGQQTLLGHLQRTDRYLTWFLLGHLALVAIVPVTTGLLADYITYRTAVIVYWLNILAIGLVSLAIIRYATQAGFVSGAVGLEATGALRRRLVLGQILYAFGAALCLIHPYWSIAFIVVVQGYFAFGPHRPHREVRPKAAPAKPSTLALTSATEDSDELPR